MTEDIVALPLGLGEKQALQLARRDEADLLLCDDLKAREAARTHGFKVKGTLGVLVEACRAGHLTLVEAETFISAIGARDDIWIAGELCERVLAALRKRPESGGPV